MEILRRPAVALALIALVTLAPRLAALHTARPENMTQDAARLLNLARSIGRGEGYVTPEAYPVYRAPARLPMPETIKEPGYPYAISAVTPLARDPFRAGQWISLLAGLLVPFAVYALGRVLAPDPRVAALAGLLAAASPLLVALSVYVMSDSLSLLVLTSAFAVAAWRPRAGVAARPWAADLATGALLGMAYLVRAQAMVAAPALLWLLCAGRPPRAWFPRVVAALAVAALVLSPWMIRNLRLFGTPLYSDVAEAGLWPYVDTFVLTHSLALPPSPVAFALAHPARVLHHTLGSVRDFTLHALPHELLGSAIWLVPLVIGLGMAVRGLRTWGPFLLFGALSAALLFPAPWLGRYFAPIVPAACIVTALGMTWLVPERDAGAAGGLFRTANVAATVVAVLLALSAWDAVRDAYRAPVADMAAARALGPFLRAHLAPGEAVMAETTSYWAWYSDRFAVHPVLADSARFTAEMRRLRVRYAVLPTSRLAEFAAHYPDRRLPSALVPIGRDATLDITLFAVRVP